MPQSVFIRFAPWMCFENNHPHDIMWPCSILYSAQIAQRAGWTARIIDCHAQKESVESLTQYVIAIRPDIVFVDTMTPTIHLTLSVAQRIKERFPDIQIWGIGQHASEATQDFLFEGSPCTGVIRGEHEAVIEQVLNSTEQYIDGCSYWNAGIQHIGPDRMRLFDIEQLPQIRPLDLRIQRYKLQSSNVPKFGALRWGFLLTSRGCPYPCTFCSPTLRQSYGRDFRMQTAESVVDDMFRLHQDYRIDAFYTIDDVFSLNKERVIDICQRIIRKKPAFRWVIQTRGDLIDKEMCALLKKAGCTGIKMGIESGSSRILSQIKKNIRLSQIETSARNIQEAGLNLTTYYMLGHPSETAEEMEETFQFARKINSDMIQVAFHTPYPGSSDWNELKKEVRDLSKLNHYETQHVNFSDMHDIDLERFQRNFYLRYYLRPSILKSYLQKRLIYQITDPREWRLLTRTFTYLVLNRETQRS